MDENKKSESVKKFYSKSKSDVLTQSNYTSGNKVGDFFLGFLGTFIIDGLIIYLGSLFLQFIYQFDSILNILAVTSSVVLLILNILVIIYLFRNKKKFIAIGIISALVIPLLIFGTCTGIFLAVSG